jgi:hypothetical protein
MSGKIFELIPKIMSEVGAIEKTRTNTQGSGYKFRGIDDVYAALQPLLYKHGVFFVPSVLKTVREERQSKAGGNLIYTVLEVKYTFFADDGSTFESVVTGEAMDSGDKSSNKAMSAALKYVLLQVFCIPTEEEKDTEYHTPEVLPKSDAKADSPPPSRAAIQPAGPTQQMNRGYFIDFGKWNKRSLEQVMRDEGPEAIADYVSYLEESAQKQGKPIQGRVATFITEAEKFLGAHENGHANGNDIPF